MSDESPPRGSRKKSRTNQERLNYSQPLLNVPIVPIHPVAPVAGPTGPSSPGHSNTIRAHLVQPPDIKKEYRKRKAEAEGKKTKRRKSRKSRKSKKSKKIKNKKSKKITKRR